MIGPLWSPENRNEGMREILKQNTIPLEFGGVDFKASVTKSDQGERSRVSRTQDWEGRGLKARSHVEKNCACVVVRS